MKQVLTKSRLIVAVGVLLLTAWSFMSTNHEVKTQAKANGAEDNNSAEEEQVHISNKCEELFKRNLAMLDQGISTVALRFWSESTEEQKLALWERLATARTIHLNVYAASNILAEPLGNTLQLNTCLQILDLENAEMGDSGLLHIARALETNTCLRSLNIAYNKITSQGIISLGGALMNNST
jgi:hypothetical protein